MFLELLNSWAVSFDLPILDWIQANMANPFLDKIMPIITLLGDAGIFWMVCAAILAFTKMYRKVGFGMAIAMALGLLVCNIILKPAVGRIRPYDFQETLGVTINLLIEKQHDFSFPSGHTIASFEACTVMMLGSRKLGIPATLLAILIAFSRLYLYVHYPTDV
ncbi:MAG: phosphatase PAP2 family protein, partial [Ruminiclostridium sp.]|nr:phosphatase PAP2 family protein [Ruminiclostridium sp.]